jgi:hypothetical protein
MGGRTWIGLVSLGTVAGCLVSVPDGSPIDAPTACTGDGDCAAPTPFCDVPTGFCLACRVDADCPADRPVCDPLGACTTCAADADCESLACLPDGTCADPARVLYAAGSGTGSECSTAMPCTLATAFGSVSATRDVIKAAPDSYPAQTGIAVVATLLATGATITGPADDIALGLTAGADLVVVGATIRGAFYGVTCEGSARLRMHRVAIGANSVGMYVSCDVAVVRSTIGGNAWAGAYVYGGTLALSNVFVVDNGPQAAGGFGMTGGIVFTDTSTGRIELSTIAGNVSGNGAGGIQCIGTHAGLAITSIIAYDNSSPDLTTECPLAHSIAGTYGGTGTANLALDPLFVDSAAGNYHIAPGSPAVGLADPTLTIPLDHDGDARPQPAGSAADSGADEIAN